MSAAEFSLERDGFRVVVHADGRCPAVHLWRGNVRLALSREDTPSASPASRSPGSPSPWTEEGEP